VARSAGSTDVEASAPGRFLITPEPLDAAALEAAVLDARCGAVATFIGRVRVQNAGREVLWLEYEAYGPLAIAAFEAIAREAVERWPDVRLAIAHRTGRLAIGEASVVIAAASPHRAEAFAACRYGIERVKQIAPVWKREHFAGGEVWIEGAVADPNDAAAREIAAARACS
jgi:molybdopterin synthase catalytic subunit